MKKRLYLRTDSIGPRQVVLQEGEKPPLGDEAIWDLLVEGNDDLIMQVSKALATELERLRASKWMTERSSAS